MKEEGRERKEEVTLSVTCLIVNIEKGIVRHFARYTFSFSHRPLDEKISTTPMSVRWLHMKLELASG